ncbi:MAG TPA: hypothetical protein VI168_11900, partial [Croceibacterium sp.]
MNHVSVKRAPLSERTTNSKDSDDSWTEAATQFKIRLVKHSGLILTAALGALASACGAGAEQAEGQQYRIPAENLLRNTFAGEYVRFVYGGSVPDDENQIGLVFTGDEVAAAIPGFRSRTQGYLGLVDESPSVIVEPSLPTSNFDEMLAANVARLDQAQDFVPYGDSGLFWPKASVS